MKFSVTTKTGCSTTIEASSWKDVQRIVKQRFGNGAIIYQISLNSVNKSAIASKLPSGCSIEGKIDCYRSSYRGESILFDVSMPAGKEKDCIAAMRRSGFIVDPNADYDGGRKVEVAIEENDVWKFLNAKSKNPVVANVIAYNLARYTSMSDGRKVKVFLENFLHEGKATRSDDYDLDRLEAFFINIGAKNLFPSKYEILKSGKEVSFEVRPTLKVMIVPM